MIVTDNENKDIARWVIDKIGGRCLEDATAIGVQKDGKILVGIMYESYTGEGGSIIMHSRCDDPKATSREFYRAIFDYPFNQLKVKRCTVYVKGNNPHAIQINERLGFKYETKLENYFPDGDALIYRMYKDECRWLKERT